mmetsp:Transcript_49224/g.110361  ORF Transcript_49224/g.110361 Transcript_49224/m.110361 type:complete len:126 (+) Transcript_49224:499-876(+)
MCVLPHERLPLRHRVLVLPSLPCARSATQEAAAETFMPEVAATDEGEVCLDAATTTVAAAAEAAAAAAAAGTAATFAARRREWLLHACDDDRRPFTTFHERSDTNAGRPRVDLHVSASEPGQLLK